MAHEVESLTYSQAGGTPWHGLGTAFNKEVSLKEAMKLAKLDWAVEKWPLEACRPKTDGPAPSHIPTTSYATVRALDETVLGIVGQNYTVLQNADAFEWFEPFISEKQAQIETAGSLRHGKHVFVLAGIKSDPLVVVKKADDIVRKYLLLANGHDGVLSARVGFTPVRVVCANTLAAASATGEGANNRLLRVFHGRRVKETVLAIRDIMSLANQEFEACGEMYERLAATSISKTSFRAYVRNVFLPGPLPRTPEAKDAAATALDAFLEKLTPLLEGGRGNDRPGVSGTLWAGYNAITEYLSHSVGKNPMVRLDSLWFGAGGAMNARALRVAMQSVR